MSKALAIAKAIRNKDKSPSESMTKSMIHKIMHKDDDEPESMDMSPEWDDGDFLSDEEQDQAQDLSYPDPDDVEGTEGMDSPEDKKRKIMARVMMSLNK
jgi:hypothetical protein